MTKDPTAGARELFEAVYEGADDAVVRLLRAGVPAEATDEDGQTVLYLASVSDEPGLVRLLLTAGADPDRPSGPADGPEGGDLPLCAAACGGHTEVVRALLAAGARPDRRESYELTAMVWAVRQGFADTAEALLEYGADPDLPGPGGEPPLLLASRRGSTATVRVLLRYGATGRHAALVEARRWMGLDVAAELRSSLLAGFGDGYETMVRRIDRTGEDGDVDGNGGGGGNGDRDATGGADGSVTVVVELLRNGRPVAGQEQQTGHAAVATLLEAELGLRTPYEELAARALRCGNPRRDDWIEAVGALARRGDEETFRKAAEWCAGDEPERQTFGAEVLARLGTEGGTGDGAAGTGFTARAVPLLRALSREAVEPELVRAVLEGLGRHGDPAALPEVLRHTGHPDARVRRRVALALPALVPPAGPDHPGGSEHPGGSGRMGRAVRAGVLLSRDADGPVRDRAVIALAGMAVDTYEVREALAARLNDPDADTAATAAHGLAVRQDPRALDALARLLADEAPDSSARRTAVDAVGHVPEGPERRRLERTLPRPR
ncbi:ankyrin repeat domain-containing protein [Streptomyces sp. NPDC093109]|uniref:ankyrin repeat domain-containing protein n=1 Tax=Streptomyces sp. NPDC093109 TaxID=3154977 RepID=UPI003450A5A8